MQASVLEHPALESTSGEPLFESPLTDRKRLSIVLQAACLLSHLESARWRLIGGWRGARVDGHGLLRSVSAGPGRQRCMPQVQLHNLLARLFLSRGAAGGRGQARRVARRLAGVWTQRLVPLVPDRAVEQILGAAEFLWGPAFGPARTSLAAVHLQGGIPETRIAGRGFFESRLLGSCRTHDEVEAALRGANLRTFWEAADSGIEPEELSRSGHWRGAVERWRRCGRLSSGQRARLARALYCLGRFDEAEREARKVDSAESKTLRVACLHGLGLPARALRIADGLPLAELNPALGMELAEVSVRCCAELGRSRWAQRWARRVLAGADGDQRARAHLVAAEAALIGGERSRAGELIDEARPALAIPELAWKWHRVSGLEALSRARARRASACFQASIGSRRRRLPAPDAADLWRLLARARAGAGDLVGAEKGARHFLRLQMGGLLHWPGNAAFEPLAEIRVRRGRLSGVRPFLDRLDREVTPRSSPRSALAAVSLRARYELAFGRPGKAIDLSRRVTMARGRRIEPESDVLRLLGARALGWLRRPSEAREWLDGVAPAAWLHLDPEERPAVWALAGESLRAAGAASRHGIVGLWGVSAGRELPPGMEPLRAARTVFDMEMAAPGSVSQEALCSARRFFELCGARGMASQLSRSSTASWEALESFCRSQTGDPGQVAELFEAAGYSHVALTWRSPARQSVLVAGAGGQDHLSTEVQGGQLVLAAPSLDPALKALFFVVARGLRPPEADEVREAGSRIANRGGILGSSAALLRALDVAEKLSPGRLPILILGETGTGKELVAQRVHTQSGRSERPFLAVNCAALPESLLLSDLFGHVRGSFTGAEKDRAGIFESAMGGTVFLDEVGDLPIVAQGKLLRVLQEGEVRRVGESRVRRIEVRILTATHRDLDAMVERGDFRQDLYYRLCVGCVELPPLRERGKDILTLADHFTSSRGFQLSRKARAGLAAYSWPGNVRELSNVLEVAMALADGKQLLPEHLKLPGRSEARSKGARGGYHQRVHEFRHQLVEEALRACSGNAAAAARRLGLSRQALSYLKRTLEIA